MSTDRPCPNCGADGCWAWDSFPYGDGEECHCGIECDRCGYKEDCEGEVIEEGRRDDVR